MCNLYSITTQAAFASLVCPEFPSSAFIAVVQSQYAAGVALSPQKVDLLDVDPASLSRLKRPCVLDDPAACDETLRRIAEVPAA
ncbi:hypothetical protein QA639_09205 [Bradyrhizobium pachyrhizi]|uniref:hypothetical protein n=1 Tax=Bradyrhizobium pachyrhizi TaxID=280333 RepID=UPI0024B1EB17|nr:hypothetical protein [Bradyrhizobium pachyrhizi]WFU57670.1 hypothetical protein QA639_09205 [Bradyrhizobium pachyrhizi]